MLSCVRLSAQTVTVLADNPDDGCRIKLQKLKTNIDVRRKKYEFNVQEYKEGLFCSECGRTKSEIEDRVRISFNQHIKDGAAHHRLALVASRELYNTLYTEYLTDFNQLKSLYDEQYNNCGGDGASAALQTISDGQWQLYKTKLSAYLDVDSVDWSKTREKYDFYYAWTLKIKITTWRTYRFSALEFEKNNVNVRRNETGNAIEQAGNMFNNFLQQ